MEIVETSISNLLKYINYINFTIIKNINESLEREELLKSLILSEKIINFLIETMQNIDLKFSSEFELILNEIYTTVRKINFSLCDYLNSDYFSKDKNFKSFKNCCTRSEIYLKSLYDDVRVLNNLNDSNKNSSNKKKSFFSSMKQIKLTHNTTFLLNIKNQKNIPNSCENIFTNLIQFKDKVYYIKTEDAFGFFYFYRNEEGLWFWSPPKKTDLEDIWMQVPQIKITLGYWEDKNINLPNYIENFILWLNLFAPNSPEFYIKNNLNTNNNDNQNDYNKITSESENIKKEDCIIY